jgi:serpin B
LESLFDPMRADFSGITSDPAGLVLSAIMHKACIKLDENGTEASAATLVAMAAGCSPEEKPQPLPFIVDRPFMYVIRERASGAILFAGRMVHPYTT